MFEQPPHASAHWANQNNYKIMCIRNASHNQSVFLKNNQCGKLHNTFLSYYQTTFSHPYMYAYNAIYSVSPHHKINFMFLPSLSIQDIPYRSISLPQHAFRMIDVKLVCSWSHGSYLSSQDNKEIYVIIFDTLKLISMIGYTSHYCIIRANFDWS